MAKILLLGGTGAIGVYLAPELVDIGFGVVVTSRSPKKSDNNKFTYIKGNAHDNEFLQKILADKYDAIIDFMVYSTDEFRYRSELLLKNTNHYIFLSSSRVFAGSNLTITETSPRLLDVSADYEYLKTDEYALAKARQENILRKSRYKNWTIVRPTITYSQTRFQLGTLEANTIIFRASNKCPVILPQEMLCKRTAMTWAKDVAKMIARLTLNKNAFGEDFNACTHEHRTWDEIAQYYKKLIGLTIIPVNIDTYIKVVGNKYQVLYSRMYNRVMDNSKILGVVGMRKENLTSIYDGLTKELARPLGSILESLKINYALNAKMDKITRSSISKETATIKEKFLYYSSYIRF